jgi:hypothetical protein
METVIAIALKIVGSKLGRTLLIGVATAAISAGAGSFLTHKVAEGNEAKLTEQVGTLKDQLATAAEVNASNVQVIEAYAAKTDENERILADVQAKQAATEAELKDARDTALSAPGANEAAGPDWDALFAKLTKGKPDDRPKTLPRPKPKPRARAAITCHDPSGVVPCNY